MNFKKVLSLFLGLVLVFSLVACSTEKKPEETKKETQAEATETAAEATETAAEATETAAEATETEGEKPGTDGDFSNRSVGLVTDTGGVDDESFNQSAWAGLKRLEADTKAKVSYVQSEQDSDYLPNLNRLVDANTDLSWGVGFMLGNAVLEAAKQSPDKAFAIIDMAYDETPANLTGVVFKAQEPSYLVGYLAGNVTKTNKVGFVGGVRGVVIDQFEYGYRAGVRDAALELGKEIEVFIQYADSFGDEAKGKSITTKMYNDGADIVFHAAGGVGKGVIEAAKENGKFAIGVDQDQSNLAPENVLSSALKKVDVAIYDLSKRFLEGDNIGGQTVVYSSLEDAVGIPEWTEKSLYEKDLHDKVMKKLEEIKAGTIVPPFNEEEWKKYTAN